MKKFQIEVVDNEGKSVFIVVDVSSELAAKEIVQTLAVDGVWYPESDKKTFLPSHRIYLIHISEK